MPTPTPIDIYQYLPGRPPVVTNHGGLPPTQPTVAPTAGYSTGFQHYATNTGSGFGNDLSFNFIGYYDPSIARMSSNLFEGLDPVSMARSDNPDGIGTLIVGENEWPITPGGNGGGGGETALPFPVGIEAIQPSPLEPVIQPVTPAPTDTTDPPPTVTPPVVTEQPTVTPTVTPQPTSTPPPTAPLTGSPTLLTVAHSTAPTRPTNMLTYASATQGDRNVVTNGAWYNQINTLLAEHPNWTLADALNHIHGRQVTQNSNTDIPVGFHNTNVVGTAANNNDPNRSHVMISIQGHEGGVGGFNRIRPPLVGANSNDPTQANVTAQNTLFNTLYSRRGMHTSGSNQNTTVITSVAQLTALNTRLQALVARLDDDNDGNDPTAEQINEVVNQHLVIRLNGTTANTPIPIGTLQETVARFTRLRRAADSDNTVAITMNTSGVNQRVGDGHETANSNSSHQGSHNGRIALGNYTYIYEHIPTTGGPTYHASHPVNTLRNRPIPQGHSLSGLAQAWQAAGAQYTLYMVEGHNSGALAFQRP